MCRGILQHIVSAVDRMPSDVEWEECDRIFEVFLPNEPTSYDATDRNIIYSMNNFILRYVRISSWKLRYQ